MAESDVEVSTGVVVDLTEKTPIRVLHVDDDAVFLKVAKQCLEMQGPFQVETASSVEEAMEKMKKKTFDVIVSDYVMPGKDGLEFLKELRDSGNDVPFIIFTGRGREEVAIKALNLGADRYVSKGGDPETVYGELAYGIRQTVEIRRAEEMLRRSEEKYRNLFENAKDVIVLMDLKGNITAINKAAVEYGFKKDEVVGKNMRKFVPKKYWPKLLKELVQIARRKTVEGKIEIITPKGKKDAEYRSDPMIVDNRVVGVQSVLRDITEHKKAEEELIRLSSAAKMTTDSIVISDIDAKIIDVNEATLKMYGTDDKRDLIGKNSFDLIAPEDREKALAGTKETLGRGYVKGREYNIITKDGGRVPVEMSVAIMKDVDGKPIGFVGISRDITEHKRAEEALRDSKKNWSDSFNSLEDVMIIINKDYTIERINDNGLKLLGKTREELIGKKCYQVILGVDAPSEFCPGKRALKTGKVESVDRYMKLFDKYFSIKSSPIFNERGEIVGFVDLMRDITERKRAEEELEKGLVKYRSLVEDTDVGIITVDVEGGFIFVNKAICKVTGYSEKELIGRPFAALVHPDDRQRILGIFQEFLKNPDMKPQFEFRVIHKKGHIVHMHSAPTIFRFKGEIAGSHAIITDITERRKAEKSLQDAKEKWISLTENTDDIIMIVDGKGVIQYINRTIPPYTPEETSGKLVYDYVPREQHDIMRESLSKVFKTGKPDSFEVSSNIPKTGTIWFRAKVVPIKHDKEIPSVVMISTDITERKKAEEALRDAEERWVSLTDNTDDTIVIADNKDIIRYINRTIPPTTPEGVIGKSVYDYVSKEHHNVMRESLKKVYKTGKPDSYEVVLDMSAINPKIGTLWFNTKVVPIKTDEEISGVIMVATNITERKRAEEELKSSEDRLKVTFEFAPDAYYLNNLKGTFVDGNKAAEELTGYKRSELIGKSFLKLKLLPRSQIPRAAKLLAKNALGKPTGPDEFVLKRKDGTQVSVEIRTFPVKIKDQTLVLGIARDISERKKAEEKIRLFSDSVKASINAIAINDLNGRFTYVNLAFEKMFGYSLKELTKMTIPQLVPKEALGQLMEEILPEIKKKGGWIGEGWGQRKDGTKFPVSMSTSLVKDEKGKPIATLGSFIEITERKKAEKALKGTMEELKMTNEKMRVVGMLTRHDVRNKLSVVTGNIFLTKQKVSGDREALTCLDNAESAVRQVERIFDFARTYEKLGAEELTYMSVEKSVKEAFSVFADLHGIKVINDCRGLKVLADSLLRQLFYNLIDNSLKYGEKASKIRMYYKEVRKDQLKLVYEDDGVGIPKAEKEKIFKEGYGKGTGYGLYLIRKMCEVYGWSIRETGKHGKGAQFTMTIPKVDSKRKILYKFH
jgi:PAS domain S-box-containing protein